MAHRDETARDYDRAPRLLLLGGTSEARALSERLARETGVEALVSLAGRTSAPLASPLPTRVGGFGGVEGLRRYLIENGVDRVIDATHPFAERISANARQACVALGIPLAVLGREPWRRAPGDRWIEVADMAAAVAALGPAPRRVFLTIGRLSVPAFRAAPQHDYLIRSIEPPEPEELPPSTELILARGPFSLDDEMRLMREKKIDVLVTKNSGGPLTYAKIEAARALSLETIVVLPPSAPAERRLESLEAALDFARAKRPA
ncbi:cobalt-precorrin-6A reductase [Methylocystis bryophila]|uniref:Cobalt-precorrin-6A reductase n=1 Tax=Methylocystis bryophila TaxID=655015 RepID=A0A1W6N0G1_9HYPH|nr:cobalt-precorrin-6A reductase [Methylocystis bryophila]ARN83318.1 cobalt-precorrin-6A reductase [Methylocystis bryophila]BDV40170.1 precorrin-6A reductase [Methylocystis bryophila]